MELEDVVKELYRLGYRYLLGVEYRAREGAELPSAARIQALVYADARPFAEAVFADLGRSAVRAGRRDQGIDEGHLRGASLPMLLLEPFHDRLVGERDELRRTCRKRRFRGLGFASFHFWRFRRKRGRRPKPPSLEKAPARLRALDSGSFGPATPLYSAR